MTTPKRPRNADHVRRVNVPGPSDETLQTQFQELLSPAIYAQAAYYRSLNLRDRVLNLPLMISAILAMLWRQIPSVCELIKTLNREGVLWMKPAKVSQPALSKRLLAFPAELFQQVLVTIHADAKMAYFPSSLPFSLREKGSTYQLLEFSPPLGVPFGDDKGGG